MKTLILTLLCFSSIASYSQQRIGFEVSSRLEDLSFTTHYLKVLDGNFLVGAGLMIQGRYLGYSETNGQLRNPFSFVEDTITENGNTYTLKDYGVRSGVAFCPQFLLMGYFHEFSAFHGIRVNLNARVGLARAQVYGKYHSFTDPKYKYESVKGWIGYAAVSPEIYHTMRQSNKWTFYYGFRFPLYFNFLGYSPRYSTDIYSTSKLEVAIGLTRSIGKCEVE